MSRHSTCIIEGCEAKHYGRGLCQKHYARARRNGTLDEVGLWKPRTLRERFFKYVEKPCSHPKGCWIWTGARDKGYGHLGITRNGKTKLEKAHRVAWEMHNGPIPEGMWVLHNCFNGAGGCVNPDHLRLGTPKDNMNDWDRTGARHHNAVVPDAVVAETVRRYKAGGVTAEQLARELTEQGWPITRSPVSAWVRGTFRTNRPSSQTSSSSP